MDPITTTILTTGGSIVVRKCIEMAMEKLLRRKKKNVTPEDKRQIRKTAERMIHAATMDDVRRYDQGYQQLAAAIQRTPTKKAAVHKKTGRKTVSVRKRSSLKRGVSKTTRPKVSMKR
jgi:hypothetical protein